MSSGLKWILGKVRKIDNTGAFVKSMNANLWPIISKTARTIERIVKTTAPHSLGKWGPPGYLGGNLRRSYHVQLTPGQLRAQVGSDPGIAPYAAHVEFGTSKQKAQPHLKPAGDSQRPDFTADLRKAIADTVAGWSAK